MLVSHLKVAARLSLAGDAFSLADAVEGAWLSGEAPQGSVSPSMIGRTVIEKICNGSLFWGYSMALLSLNMFGWDCN